MVCKFYRKRRLFISFIERNECPKSNYFGTKLRIDKDFVRIRRIPGLSVKIFIRKNIRNWENIGKCYPTCIFVDEKRNIAPKQTTPAVATPSSATPQMEKKPVKPMNRWM